MTLDMIEAAVLSAKITDGRSIRRALPIARNVVTAPISSMAHYEWQPWEDKYLETYLGYKTEEEIAAHLGRSITGVHLRWKRDLHLPAPSKHPNVFTGHQAAALIGIDGHKIMHWCDTGLIPARRMRGTYNDRERVIRLINRVTFKRWLVNTDNWIYFDWRKIPDPHLRRLCELKAERWGDEWWSTAQVAKFHQVTPKDVLRLITKKKTLAGVQVATSLGGRHKDPQWLNWFVKKSDALKAVFIRGKGQGTAKTFTPRAEAWMVKAYKMGWSFQAINRSMGEKVVSWTVAVNVKRLVGEE